MIDETTSLTLNLAFNAPGTVAQIAPPSTPASTTTGTNISLGRSKVNPTAIEPVSYTHLRAHETR